VKLKAKFTPEQTITSIQALDHIRYFNFIVASAVKFFDIRPGEKKEKKREKNKKEKERGQGRSEERQKRRKGPGSNYLKRRKGPGSNYLIWDQFLRPCLAGQPKQRRNLLINLLVQKSRPDGGN
jgi:hypothetical protein